MDETRREFLNTAIAGAAAAALQPELLFAQPAARSIESQDRVYITNEGRDDVFFAWP